MATHFGVAAPAGRAALGTAFNFTVTALDPFGNTDGSYAGTVHFSSTDSIAALPVDSTLTSGTGTFSAATLNTRGTQSLTATDTTNTTITGSAAIIVSAAATHFLVTAPASTVAGTPLTYTVTGARCNQ